MQLKTTDNPERSRFELYADDVFAGYADYRLRPSAMSLPHTEVQPRFRGRGLASALIRDVLESARSRGLAVLPFCPFVSDFIRRNAEYLPLVPPDQRARFGLRLA